MCSCTQKTDSHVPLCVFIIYKLKKAPQYPAGEKQHIYASFTLIFPPHAYSTDHFAVPAEYAYCLIASVMATGIIGYFQAVHIDHRQPEGVSRFHLLPAAS